MFPELVFWGALLAVGYAYFGYPVLLGVIRRRGTVMLATEEFCPSVTVIIPVHNEERIIVEKLRNLDTLTYPRNRLQVLIVSDGSVDRTREHVLGYQAGVTIRFLELDKRSGKAAALNLGLRHANSQVVVFSDATIMLQADAIERIVQPFRDPRVGCVSGEDHIPGGGGEGLYGRYELWLRNLESRVASIAGASGSFYAVRAELCPPFPSGMAPDFLSVLTTVERGFLAVTEPTAFGTMSSTKSSRGEFQRKVRTLIRGMAALWHKRALLNPARYGLFAFVLWSHKIARWSVPFFLIALVVANGWLLHYPFYAALAAAQLAFYAVALLALYVKALSRLGIAKVALYFCLANSAIFVAWIRFLRGERLEVWQPTQR